jgi:hypothetical protein
MNYRKFMTNMYAYFSKPLPKKETAEIWRSEIGNYPEDFYTWAYGAIKNREKKFPDSPPFAVRELWQEWLRRNPDKRETHEFRCSQALCKDGWLFVVKDRASYAFRCGDCKALSDYPNIPESTFEELRKQGYTHPTVQDTIARIPKFDAAKWKGKLTPIGEIGVKL